MNMGTILLRIAEGPRTQSVNIVRRALDYHMKVQNAQLVKTLFVALANSASSVTNL